MQEIWTFKHEPKKIKDMIVSDAKGKILKSIIKDLPNTLIYGKPGTGKGTFMNILIKQSGCDYIKINGSDETGIDVVRDKIKTFSSSFSLNKKVVYINESDRLSINAQNSLNQIIEDTQHITRFYFVCNNPERLSDPIMSRCAFKIDLNDPPAKEIFSYILNILQKEKITVKNKSSIVSVIKKLYPDIRQIIGTIQSNIINKEINDISFSTSGDLYKSIFDNMLKLDMDNVRKLLKSHYIDYVELYNYCYTQVMDEDIEEIKKPAEFILLTGEFMYKDNFVGIKEINYMAYMLNLMKQSVI